VYLATGKLDEVCSSTIAGPARILCASDAPNYAALADEAAAACAAAGFVGRSLTAVAPLPQAEDAFFYRYEYSPHLRSGSPAFTQPGGAPLAADAWEPAGAEQPAELAAPMEVEALPAAARGSGGGAAAAAIALAMQQQAPPPPADVAAAQRQAGGGAPGARQRGGGGRSNEERLAQLQAKLDRQWPPFTDVSGVQRREFTAVIPPPGDRYAGEGCARCEVEGCDRRGAVFHLKNLLTHSQPRGGQPVREPARPAPARGGHAP